MLINEESLKHLKTLEDNTFDSCVTDPPYHLASILKRFGPGQKGINNKDEKEGRNWRRMVLNGQIFSIIFCQRQCAMMARRQ